MTTFFYNMIDKNNCPINPQPLEVEAKDLGHAMQKVAACLSDHCTDVHVWRTRKLTRQDIAKQVKALGADSLLPPGYKPRRKGAKR